MAQITKKLAKFAGVLAFFVIFLVGVLSHREPDFVQILVALLKGCIGASIFWILGVVISDIALKGMLESIDATPDNKWEGGVVSRFAAEREGPDKPAGQEETVSPVKKKGSAEGKAKQP